MSERKADGGPAFPDPAPTPTEDGAPGISHRDLIALTVLPTIILSQVEFVKAGGTLPGDHKHLASLESYRQADSMLKARDA